MDSIQGNVTPLSAEERKEILSNVLANQSESIEDKISQSLMTYVKTLYMDKKYTQFYYGTFFQNLGFPESRWFPNFDIVSPTRLA